MDTPAPGTPGYLGSLRSLVDGLLTGVQDRFELFTVELQEEKFRLIQTFIWISAGIFTAMMAILFASLTLVYFCREGTRLFALGGLTVFYAAALLAILTAFGRFVARQPRPFSATRTVMTEDRTCIPKPS